MAKQDGVATKSKRDQAAQAEDERLAAAAPVANRYQLVRRLGRGGAAAVYEALDLARGQRVALKQLRATGRRADSGLRRSRATVERLFELEFHTLSQLRHPSIVEVYEYGQDERGPFYTMRLLEGTDLSSLCPLPFRRACEILMQVCSGLSRLHARRLVHRDVKPRNIHCPPTGRATLIDFGAMAAVGPCEQVVGTPPFLSPEVFGLQTIDARTDLFALGATAYFALTGHHAYPARDVASLPVVWSKPPPPPSQFAKDVPALLDELVMSLLCLDPLPRPRSAVEVMQRLSAIAGLPQDEATSASHALSTPLLVGRQDVLAQARAQIEAARGGRGGALLLTGPPGAGRSACLDVCVLSAKLDGLPVLRMDRRAAPLAWGGVRSLLGQLRAQLGAAWDATQPAAAALDRRLAQSAPSGPPAAEPDAGALHAPSSGPARAEVLECVRDAIISQAKAEPLAVAVDDIECLDEPSAALIALLARATETAGLWLLVTTDPQAAAVSEPARSALLRVAVRAELRPLQREETRQMLASMVGDAMHLDLLTERLHAAARGVPRRIVWLTQHLVDRHAISVRNGAFVLPEALPVEQLPADEASLHRVRAADLSAPARALAERLSLCPRAGVRLTEIAALCVAPSPQGDCGALAERPRVGLEPDHLQALDELHAAGLLQVAGGYCALSDRGVRAALAQGLDAETTRRHCLHLAGVFAQKPHRFPWAVDYLVRADEPDRAVSVLLASLERRTSTESIGAELAARLADLPSGWFDTCERLLRHCQTTGAPRRAVHRIRDDLFSTALLVGEPATEHVIALLSQLAHDSGLDLYAGYDESTPADTRAARALQAAQERFAQADPQTRVMPPDEAVPRLARATSQALALMSPAGDIEGALRLPDISPLAPLSPALALMTEQKRLVLRNIKGFEDEARAGYLSLVERLEQPDGAGLDPHTQRYVRLSLLFAVGVGDVVRECDSCLSIADALELDPLFSGHALTLRRYYALLTGDVEAAERARDELELRSIREAPGTLLAGRALWLAAQCHARREDLLGLQESIATLERLARRDPVWRPRLLLLRAIYERIRGDHAAAERDIAAAAAKLEPGRHGTWVWVACERSQIARLAGDPERARVLSARDLQSAETLGLGWTAELLRLELGLSELALDRPQPAVEHIERVIATLSALGSAGALMGQACEARALAAAAADDRSAFSDYAARCARYYRPSLDAAFAARYERLLRRDPGARAESASAAPAPAQAAHGRAALKTVFEGCRDRDERASRALETLLAWGGSANGMLYLLGEGGPSLAAASPDRSADDRTAQFVRAFLDAELDGGASTTVTEAEHTTGHSLEPCAEASFTDTDGRNYTALPMMHAKDGCFWVTGAVLLDRAASRHDAAPEPLLHRISQALQEHGDAIGISLT